MKSSNFEDKILIDVFLISSSTDLDIAGLICLRYCSEYDFSIINFKPWIFPKYSPSTVISPVSLIPDKISFLSLYFILNLLEDFSTNLSVSALWSASDNLSSISRVFFCHRVGFSNHFSFWETYVQVLIPDNLIIKELISP